MKSAPIHPRETLSKRKFNLAPASLFPSRQPAQEMGKERNNAIYDCRCKLPLTLTKLTVVWPLFRANFKTSSNVEQASNADTHSKN